MADSDQPEGKLSISPKLNKRVMDENKTKGNLEELQQPVGRDREVCVCVFAGSSGCGQNLSAAGSIRLTSVDL